MRGSVLLPLRFALKSSWESHGRWVNDGVLRKQSLDVLREGVIRIDAVEPVGDVAECAWH